MPERPFSLPPVIGDGPAAGDDPGGGGDGSDVPRRRPARVVLSSGSDRVASSPDRAFDQDGGHMTARLACAATLIAGNRPAAGGGDICKGAVNAVAHLGVRDDVGRVVS